VDEVIEPLTAHGEGAHGKTVHKALLGVVHRAALNEIHHGLGKHFRVDSQMPLAPQLICYGVWDVADTELDGGAVLYKRGHKGANFFVYLGVGHQGLGGDRAVGLHKGIHLGNMYLCITKGARKVGVDLQQNQRTLIDQVPLIDCADREGKVAVGVHGGDRGQHHGPAALGLQAL